MFRLNYLQENLFDRFEEFVCILFDFQLIRTNYLFRYSTLSFMNPLILNITWQSELK